MAILMKRQVAAPSGSEQKKIIMWMAVHTYVLFFVGLHVGYPGKCQECVVFIQHIVHVFQQYEHWCVGGLDMQSH